jgi:hypothetical protein
MSAFALTALLSVFLVALAIPLVGVRVAARHLS